MRYWLVHKLLEMNEEGAKLLNDKENVMSRHFLVKTIKKEPLKELRVVFDISLVLCCIKLLDKVRE